MYTRILCLNGFLLDLRVSHSVLWCPPSDTPGCIVMAAWLLTTEGSCVCSRNVTRYGLEEARPVCGNIEQHGYCDHMGNKMSLQGSLYKEGEDTTEEYRGVVVMCVLMGTSEGWEGSWKLQVLSSTHTPRLQGELSQLKCVTFSLRCTTDILRQMIHLRGWYEHKKK